MASCLVLLGHPGCVPLKALLERTSQVSTCRSLFSQLCYGVAERLQKKLLEDKVDGDMVQASIFGSESVRSNPQSVDFFLARYMEAGAACVGQPMFLSMACDKATIKGLSLSNAVAVTPSNICVVLPPQAVLVYGSARSASER